MVQVGFVIGIGILLDTFLVRTITVPAVAALVGQANWWPSRPNCRMSRRNRHRRFAALPRQNGGRHDCDHAHHRSGTQKSHQGLLTLPRQTGGDHDSDRTNRQSNRAKRTRGPITSRATLRAAAHRSAWPCHRRSPSATVMAVTKGTNISRATLSRCSVRTPCQPSSPQMSWKRDWTLICLPTANTHPKRTANTQPKPRANDQSKNFSCLYAKAGDAWASLPTNVRHKLDVPAQARWTRHPETIRSMSRDGLGAGPPTMRPSRWAPTTATRPPRRPDMS